ncbi:DNA ligase 4 [Halyomorpha halys]|uniref:DNA ligase 4 n=1 Tax=Halyomorpha halys TaxID=286706 RepID=UPI0006D513E9|nr:DNA ligase 4 [Halyomorpha halys]
MTEASYNVNEIPFHHFCKLCEKIKSQKIAKKRVEILRTFIENVMKKNPVSFFPILRLLLPQLDRERGPYGMKEINLARTYKRILSLPPNGFEAERLMNFSKPAAMTSGAMGDFAEVVCCILRTRCGEGNEMTIGDVNQALDNIANKHKANDPRGVDDEFTNMVQKMSNEEQKWLIRIIIKEMGIGLGTNRMLGLYHPDAVELYSLTNSICQVCSKLKDRNVRYHELDIELFRAFKPMLCERVDIHNLSLNSMYFVENKFDGERFQLHYKDRKFKYFSRNGYEYSVNYGEDPESGYFTSLIMKQLDSSLISCILDGEMMGWHRGSHKLISKGKINLDVKKLKVGSTIQPCFCVFDVVLYNDEIVTSQTYKERVQLLEKIFTPLEGVIMAVERSLINSTEQVFEALNSAIDNCEEGIILKDPDSIYKAHSRKDGWLKIKPDYSEGTVDLDLLIIGGYYGTGRMKGQICHFLLGVAAEESDNPNTFMSVARVSSGLSDSERAELTSKLNCHWKTFKRNDPPSFLLLKREKPDVYIFPRCSKILQVKSPEVMRSDAYYTGYTLRFVRVERIREDKLWSDCLSIGEFNKLRMAYSGKLTAGHVLPKTRRKRKLEENQTHSQPKMKVEKTSDIFSGKEICILSGIEGHSKQDLENLVLGNGGSIVQQPMSSTFCVVFGSKNIRIQNVIRAKKHNVTTHDWLLKCVSEERLIPWDRLNLVSCDLKTDLIISEQYDTFGDSYYDSVTPEQLRTIFGAMPPVTSCSEEEVKEIDQLLFNKVSPFSMFRNVYAYFDSDETEIASLKNAELIFKFYNGIACSEVSRLVNYIILDETHLDNLKRLDQLCNNSQISCEFISYKWIMSCFNNMELEDHRNYLIIK